MAQVVVQKEEEEEKQEKQKKETKKKGIAKLGFKDEWLDHVIESVKPILHSIEVNMFEKYRTIGKIILDAGYQKGQWHSQHKERFMKELGVDRSTFSLFIRLGEMTTEAFQETVDTYASIKAWYRGGKTKAMSEQRKKLIQGLVTRFPNFAKQIKEILRYDRAYLSEKDLADFNTLVSKSGENPIDVFIKHYYLTADSGVKLPVWALIGFEEYAERKGMENQTPEAVIRKILSENLQAADINKEAVAVRAKNKLRVEWGL